MDPDSQRRRSRRIGLTIMAGGAAALAAPLIWFASSPVTPEPEPPQAAGPRYFANPEECATQFDRAQCAATFDEARTEYLGTAPAYADRETCEARHGTGACGPQTIRPTVDQLTIGGGSPTSPGRITTWYLPLMTGYLYGRQFGVPTYAMPFAGQACPSGRYLANGACAVGPNSSSATSGGSSWRPRLGSVTWQPGSSDASTPRSSTPDVATSPSPTQRGGFGSTARSATGVSS
jgi:uncharacterized protein YgiB involved in biofilm formation